MKIISYKEIKEVVGLVKKLVKKIKIILKTINLKILNLKILLTKVIIIKVKLYILRL